MNTQSNLNNISQTINNKLIPAGTILPAFDIEGLSTGEYLVADYLDISSQQNCTANTHYIDIGSGNEIVIATSPKDAAALIQANKVFSRIIAPVTPDGLIALCQKLAMDMPSAKYILTGCRQWAKHASTARRILKCKSYYPPDAFDSWSSFEQAEGIKAVIGHLHKFDEEDAAVSCFTVTDEHIENIGEETFVFDNLIIQQHIVVICAEPNAGKTTICNWICSQISELYKVRYLNLDCSGADLKYYQQYAKNENFSFINFDITETSDKQFFESLDSCVDLSKTVYFIDTLKKFSDLMGKNSVKCFMSRLRTYCNRGATFVLLAHTNKHKSKEGKPIFEGVGDVKSDCDELIYLIPVKNNDDSITVSTLPDKTRGAIQSLSFVMNADRTVFMTDYVDVLSLHKQKIDAPVIQSIENAFASGKFIQQDIINYCKQQGFGKHKVSATLEHYARSEPPLWSRTKAANNNAWVYAKS